MKKNALLFYAIAIIFISIAVAGAYTAWNALDPEYTCANCHEVKPSHQKWAKSVHSKVACVECHGTALSNGIHSLKEKIGMVFTHINGNKKSSDVRLSEKQVVDLSKRCVQCHKSESSAWKSGAHSTTYSNIFEDKVHNQSEKPYWDCFRCHGMFYSGNVYDLMDLQGDSKDWKIKDSQQASMPAIPCLACHQIHSEKKLPQEFQNHTQKIALDPKAKTAFYIRTEKMHLNSDDLVDVNMYLNGKKLKISNDSNHRLCIQCHSPNWKRQAESSDDRTQCGVHEGFSCLICHNPHSLDASKSCVKCHDSSAISKFPATVKKPKTPQCNIR